MLLVPIGLRLCLLFLVVGFGAAAGSFRFRCKEHNEHEIRQFKQEFGDDSKQELWFEQKVDHFNPSSNITWKQVTRTHNSVPSVSLKYCFLPMI